MGHDIQIDQVTMRFGHLTALADIHVHIQAGEFFSFLGPSGCGKTTLLKLISGFLEPTRGHIRIDGKDMKGVGPNRRPTAMIFQNLALFPLMTVAQNIGFALDIRKVSTREKNKRIPHCWDWWTCPMPEINRSMTCPEDRSSGSPSPEPWPWNPPSCCWTNPCPHWI